MKTVWGRVRIKQVVLNYIDNLFERFGSEGLKLKGGYLWGSSHPIFCFSGFPHTLICSLNNTSLVPMTFKLRIPGDGHESISSCEQYTDTKGPSWNKEEIPITKPREFTITPNCGTIRSQGFAAIRVKCTHPRQLSSQMATGTTPRVCSACPEPVGRSTSVHMETWAYQETNHCGERNRTQIHWAEELTPLRGFLSTSVCGLHQIRGL